MKRTHYLIFALILLIAALPFGIIGFITWRNTPQATEVSDYGMMPFYVYSFGYGTAYNEDSEDSEASTMQYVEYRSQDGRFSFVREVSNDEFLDFEMARENQAEHRPVQRYVYTYRLNGEMQTIIQEQELSDNQLREIIGNTNRVSAWQYWMFSVILMIAGGYFLYLGMKKSQRERG
jgi:hypothetical protein